MKKRSNSDLGRINVEEFKKAVKIPVVIVLDNVRSMHNVGSVFRTADAFLCEAVYLCGITSAPPHREIEKTALGATESVTWKYFNTTLEALELLKESGYKLIAVEQAEEGVLLDMFRFNPDEKYAIIFGHEMNGVSHEVMQVVNESIEVPQSGTKHSLNISVCAGIVIWEFYKKYKI